MYETVQMQSLWTVAGFVMFNVHFVVDNLLLQLYSYMYCTLFVAARHHDRMGKLLVSSIRCYFGSFLILKIDLCVMVWLFMTSPSDSVSKSIMFSGWPSATLVCSSGQILLPQYLMNGLSSLDETYRVYSLAPTDNLIRFWRSKVTHSRPLR